MRYRLGLMVACAIDPQRSLRGLTSRNAAGSLRPTLGLTVAITLLGRADATQTRRESKNQLCLGYQSHESSLFGFQSRLPDLCSASAMKRRSGGYHGRALFGGTHEVRFALDGGSALGICRKVYECRCTARRVSKRHRTAAMDSMLEYRGQDARPFSQLPCLARRA